MDSSLATRQTTQYNITIPVFAGPLDLLLHLIERAELDITRVALAQVTDQYLQYLEALQERSADDVSSFLVIAAKLIQIKSEALLPRPPVREEGEEDPGEALARQLKIYKRFKELSQWLGRRDTEGLHTYVRLAPPPRVEGRVDLEGVGVPDLVRAARAVFARSQAQPEVGQVVVAPRVTIRGKIRLVVDTLRRRGKSGFLALVGKTRTRVEIVVTFLAVLELVKRRRIAARQEGLFQEIELEPAESWDEDEDFELEFDE